MLAWTPILSLISFCFIIYDLLSNLEGMLKKKKSERMAFMETPPLCGTWELRVQRNENHFPQLRCSKLC